MLKKSAESSSEVFDNLQLSSEMFNHLLSEIVHKRWCGLISNNF